MKPLPLALLVLSLAACDGSSSDDPEVIGGLVVAAPRSVPFAVDPSTEVSLGTRWLAYLASETAGGQDINLDQDALDQVAVAFDTRDRAPTPLSAARDVVVVGSNVYLVTEEDQDSLDWSGDGDTDDLVLLHWSAGAGVTSFVIELGSPTLQVVEDWLYASRAPNAPALPMQTSLVAVRPSSPVVPVPVFAADFETAARQEILGADEGMLFLLQREDVSQRDLNGDGDMLDDVLALLEGAEQGATVKNVKLAVDADTAFRANRLVTDDWAVAFLVDEADQGATNLNDAADFPLGWQPDQCTGFVDADTTDDVLHVLRFRAWFQSAVASPPVNTGIAAIDRVFVVESVQSRIVVGALSQESESAGCPLNDDGDATDLVVRWGELVGGSFVAHTDPDEIVAVEAVEGSSLGLAEVSGRVALVIDEEEDERDWDQDPDDHDVLAWMDFFGAGGWQVPRRTSPSTALGIGWLSEHPSRRGLLFGDRESVLGDCNTPDSDATDMFAVAGRFDPTDADEFEWTGYCYAAESFNIGAVVVGNTLFFRASEAEQGRDANEDGDMDDLILLRHRIFPLGTLFYVDVLNGLDGPAVVPGPGETVAFLVDEAMAEEDRNGDGDTLDHVLRYVSTN